MRYTVTIPAAGEKTIVPLSGRSIIVEEMGVYPTAADVPTMNFISGISDNPLYPRSVYPNSQRFDQVEIIGTAESAGDEVTLLATDQCLNLDINIDFSGTYEAQAGTTSEQTLSDSVYSFNAVAIQNANGKLPKAVYIEAAEDEVKFAFNTDPVQGAGGLGYILETPSNQIAVEPLEIRGIDFILALRFINATSATDAKLIYTFEY